MPLSICLAILANGPVSSSTAPTLSVSCAPAPVATPASAATATAAIVFFSVILVSLGGIDSCSRYCVAERAAASLLLPPVAGRLALDDAQADGAQPPGQ